MSEEQAAGGEGRRPREAPPLSTAHPPLPAARSTAAEIVETLVIAALLFIGMRLLILPVQVDGSSMLPTLTEDQHLLVNRRAYWHFDANALLNHLPGVHARGERIVYLYHKPERGDIIVLTPPPTEARRDIPFIKRIVGLPGDTILVRGGRVAINGQPIDEPYIAAPPEYTWPASGQPLTIPPHNVVVFGDNRNRSEDSSRFGLLDEHYIRGKAFATFWPIGEIGFLPHPTYAVDRNTP